MGLFSKTSKTKRAFSAFASPVYHALMLNLIAKNFPLLYVQSVVLTANDKGRWSALPVARALETAQNANLWLIILLLLIWMRPIFKYRKTIETANNHFWDRPLIPQNLDAIRTAIRSRLENVYSHLGILFAAQFLCSMIVFWMYHPSASEFFFILFPSLIIVFAAQACSLFGQVNTLMSVSSETMEMLYTKEELFQLRKGPALSLFTRTTLLVVSFAMVPLMLVCIASIRDTAAYIDMVEITILCMISLVIGLMQILKTTQRPLDGLIEKMERVAAGEYDLKTRIYFRDEVARLKAGFNNMLDGLREREEMRNTFGRYVSAEIARELLKNKKVNLGGDEIEAAVLFCDIRDFTPISERLGPQQVVEFLNGYFAFITKPLAAHNGVINKFLGDGFMAVFTPAMGSQNYAADSVRAALEMRAALADYNSKNIQSFPVRFGIGIHTGLLVAGNVGTAERTEYTFIGDTVNCAARIESKTKELGTDILVSDCVIDLMEGAMDGEAVFESAGSAMLKGKSLSLNLYRVTPAAAKEYVRPESPVELQES